MARLGKRFESVCSEDGKENLNQPYLWLGVEDPDGSGDWRARVHGAPNATEIAFANWDDDEGSEGDTCARMQGNGTKYTVHPVHDGGTMCLRRAVAGHGVQEERAALLGVPHQRPAAGQDTTSLQLIFKRTTNFIH